MCEHLQLKSFEVKFSNNDLKILTDMTDVVEASVSGSMEEDGHNSFSAKFSNDIGKERKSGVLHSDLLNKLPSEDQSCVLNSAAVENLNPRSSPEKIVSLKLSSEVNEEQNTVTQNLKQPKEVVLHNLEERETSEMVCIELLYSASGNTEKSVLTCSAHSVSDEAPDDLCEITRMKEKWNRYNAIFEIMGSSECTLDHTKLYNSLGFFDMPQPSKRVFHLSYKDCSSSSGTKRKCRESYCDFQQVLGESVSENPLIMDTGKNIGSPKQGKGKERKDLRKRPKEKKQRKISTSEACVSAKRSTQYTPLSTKALQTDSVHKTKIAPSRPLFKFFSTGIKISNENTSHSTTNLGFFERMLWWLQLFALMFGLKKLYYSSSDIVVPKKREKSMVKRKGMAVTEKGKTLSSFWNFLQTLWNSSLTYLESHICALFGIPPLEMIHSLTITHYEQILEDVLKLNDRKRGKIKFRHIFNSLTFEQQLAVICRRADKIGCSYSIQTLFSKLEEEKKKNESY